jgi:hypothetical protein
MNDPAQEKAMAYLEFAYYAMACRQYKVLRLAYGAPSLAEDWQPVRLLLVRDGQTRDVSRACVDDAFYGGVVVTEDEVRAAKRSFAEFLGPEEPDVQPRRSRGPRIAIEDEWY